ncbi:single-stranded DNA-binding protein [Desulfovirgula thermocuniculi]|uniref:single-stranded DNA-binding protein n=1 Tax=Desulfovirgula thermocuniculi TaxID=348842 RepID=UPI000402CD48|nr:single-stranded DNA-binding protein [Desulfovirgula thermocuniculi]
MNIVALTGRLARDPELRETDSNVPVCRIVLAVRKPFSKDLAGYFDCYLFREQAKIAKEYLAKGRQVSITGWLRERIYEDNQGVRRRAVDIMVDRFEFLDVDRVAASNTVETAGGLNANESDLPF